MQEDATLSVGRGRQGAPGYVQREFEDYLKCGRLKHKFLRVLCETCHEEGLVAFSCKRRGFAPVATRDAWPREEIKNRNCSIRYRAGHRKFLVETVTWDKTL